jgi:hypothetical protein
MIGEDSHNKPQFYDPQALVCSEEHLTLLMTLVSGLDCITFRIDLDSSTLDPSKGGTIQFEPKAAVR